MSLISNIITIANDNHEKENYGIKFKHYLDCTKYGLELFKDKEKMDYLIDIIPFMVETDFHPNPKIKKGMQTYNLDIWVHKGIGNDNESFLCKKKTYEQKKVEKCLICEKYLELRRKNYTWEEIEYLYPKRRNIYYIKYDKKLYVYDTSYKLFEEIWYSFISRRNSQKGIEIFPIYSDVPGSVSLIFSVTKNKGIGRYVNFDFVEIENYQPIKEKLISLEQLLVTPDENYLTQILETEEEHVKKKMIEKENKKQEENVEKEDSKQYYNNYIVKGNETNKELVCPFEHIIKEDWDKYTDCDQCKEENTKLFTLCKENYENRE